MTQRNRRSSEPRISYECPTEFNVLTNLKSCDGYRKKLQESTDPLKYRFDIRPGPMCYMPGQAFQGLQMAVARKPPPQLLDMEMALHTMPLKEEDNEYVIKDIRNAAPPAMPSILSNRLVIPDCRDIMQWQRTKIRRIDFPQFSQRMDKMGFYLTNYMRPGRDTRAEMRDAFKKYEEMKNKSSDVYGIGKIDSRSLKPATDPKCNNADSNLDCMHVYGPDAKRTNQVIDPTFTLNDLTARQDVGFAGGPGTAAAVTQAYRVAQTIDPTVPFSELIKGVQTENNCIARFYGYKPAGCP